MGLGAACQVAIIANCGPQRYQSFDIEWPWGGVQISEYAGISQPLSLVSVNMVSIVLEAFQVKVGEFNS